MRILQPLRLRDFRLLWLGMAVSMLGDGIYLVTIAFQAARTGARRQRAS